MMCLLAGCGHNGPYTATTANTVVTTEETEEVIKEETTEEVTEELVEEVFFFFQNVTDDMYSTEACCLSRSLHTHLIEIFYKCGWILNNNMGII